MPIIKWTKEFTAQVIDGIEGGKTLRQVGESVTPQISAAAIIRHVIASEEFSKQYARALQIRGDVDFESLADVIEAEPERGKWGIDPGWANWQRTRIDALKWMISKRNPKKYGERTALTGPDGEGPIQVELADRLSKALKRNQE